MDMRQYIRHPSEMPIHYQVNETSNKNSFETKVLRDVSPGGLSFHTEQQMDTGDSLHIEIQVEPPPFSADGTVVWCRKEKDGFQVGLQFEDADVNFSLRMIEQICHIEQYRQDILKKEGRKLNSEEAAQEWISIYAADFPY